MNSALENLCGPGKPLKAEPPDEAEIADWRRRPRDAAEDCHPSLAYGAAHSLCLAALRRRGYRATQRYIVFQVLPHTLGFGPEVWRVLSRCHDLRNLAEYEGESHATEELVEELITICQRLVRAIEAA